MPEQDVIREEFLADGSGTAATNFGIKRPDSLTSLASLNSIGSAQSTTSSKHVYDRQLSVSSLTSLEVIDLDGEVTCDLAAGVNTPDSEFDAGIHLDVSGSSTEYSQKECHQTNYQENHIDTAGQEDKNTSDQAAIEECVIKPDVQLERFEHASAEVKRYINFSLRLLKIVGTINENILFRSRGAETNRKGYAPLYSAGDFGGFHYRNIFRRWQDCFCNPINSAATDMVSLMERKFESSFSSRYTLAGESRWYINLGSYNYLGFGGVGTCSRQAELAARNYGIGGASVRQEVGTQRLHVQLEALVAEFLGVEDAITFGMGFATNSMNLPGIVHSSCLVLSDKMNHASIILGMRLSGATIGVFEHNDMVDLERQLIRAVTSDSRRWSKILIVVEGIYSMEGSLVRLPDVIRLKKRYGAYLYLDEAHSIGALGKSGRGVIEHFGCRPQDVDVLMGTFTKSFGAAGGYIGGNRSLVGHLRAQSQSAAYACAMPPAVCQQVMSSMRIIMGLDGTRCGRDKIEALAANAVYFRRRLRQLGFIVYGDDASPVVPLMSFFVSKTAALYRRLKDHSIAAAVIAYPATPLDAARARFCLSASHTRQQLDYVLQVLDKLGDELEIKYSKRSRECGASSALPSNTAPLPETVH